MTSFDIIGYAAGFFVAIALLPQVIKAWKTKSTKDISILWNFILMTGLFLWVIYGIINFIFPIMVFTSIELAMTISLLILKIKYK